MINMLRKGIKFSIQRVYFPQSYFESRHYGKRFNSIGKFKSLTFQLRAIYFHTFAVDMSVYIYIPQQNNIIHLYIYIYIPQQNRFIVLYIYIYIYTLYTIQYTVCTMLSIYVYTYICTCILYKHKTSD